MARRKRQPLTIRWASKPWPHAAPAMQSVTTIAVTTSCHAGAATVGSNPRREKTAMLTLAIFPSQALP